MVSSGTDSTSSFTRVHRFATRATTRTASAISGKPGTASRRYRKNRGRVVCSSRSSTVACVAKQLARMGKLASSRIAKGGDASYAGWSGSWSAGS